MKLKFLLLASIVFFSTKNLSAQTKMVNMKAGHVFNISLPDYMDKTVGLNDASVFQFKNLKNFQELMVLREQLLQLIIHLV